MEKKRDPRIKPTHSWPVNLPQWKQEYIELATNIIQIFLYDAMEKLERTIWPTQPK